MNSNLAIKMNKEHNLERIESMLMNNDEYNDARKRASTLFGQLKVLVPETSKKKLYKYEETQAEIESIIHNILADEI